MQIYEKEIEHENGEKYLLIIFNHHRAEIFRTEIPLKHERCAALRIAKAKESAIDEFLTTFNGKKYTKKEVLKAYAKQDEYFKGVYKELYPQGGKRDGGGRPKGTKTDKTESLGTRISAKEKDLLLETLNNYRKREEKSQEEIKNILAPIFMRIDESFGDDENARQKWRKKFGNINPALFPQLLEYILLFGIDKLIPEKNKFENLTLQNDFFIRVMSKEQTDNEK